MNGILSFLLGFFGVLTFVGLAYLTSFAVTLGYYEAKQRTERKLP